MAVGDIWRIAFEGKLLGSQYVNVWHIKLIDAAATVGGAITEIDTQFYAALPPWLMDGWSIEIARARQLTVPANLYEQAVTAVGSNVGTTELPPQCAMVCTLRTGVAGRSRRGRMYLGGFGESGQDSGQWGVATLNGIQAAYDTILGRIGASGTSTLYRWGIWSRKLGGQDPGPYNLTAGWKDITAAVCRSLVYTQRRRVSGVGS